MMSLVHTYSYTDTHGQFDLQYVVHILPTNLNQRFFYANSNLFITLG